MEFFAQASALLTNNEKTVVMGNDAVKQAFLKYAKTTEIMFTPFSDEFELVHAAAGASAENTTDADILTALLKHWGVAEVHVAGFSAGKLKADAWTVEEGKLFKRVVAR